MRYGVCTNLYSLTSNFLFPALPFPSEGYPERKEDELKVKEEALFFDVEKVISELLPAKGISWEINLCNTC